METKTDYLRVRLTREEKMKLDLNSTRQGMTISDYAKSGLRYQKVLGRQVEDIQNIKVYFMKYYLMNQLERQSLERILEKRKEVIRICPMDVHWTVHGRQKRR